MRLATVVPFLLVTSAFCPPANADYAEVSILKCREISDSEARLKCYDALPVQATISPQAAVSQTLAEREAELARREAALKVREEGLKSADLDSPENQVAYFGMADPFKPGAKQDSAATALAVTKTTANKDDDGRVESIEAAVREFTIGPTGLAIIVLENGQVWRQIAGETPRFVSDVRSNVVKISRATFGSYLMSVNGSNKQQRVRRIDGGGR
jgi:hypothetical protein